MKSVPQNIWPWQRYIFPCQRYQSPRELLRPRRR